MSKLGIAGIALLCSCSSLPSPSRAEARGALLLLAEGVRAADLTCADLARASSSLALATRCAAGYRAARAGLVAAGEAIDAGASDSLVCSLAAASRGLSELASAIGEAKLPAVTADARMVGRNLEGICRGR